jgi:outer membrane immunogenic protein
MSFNLVTAMYRAFSAAALILASATAWAADLPAEPALVAPPPAPAYSWTGFYAGVSGGWAWSGDDTVGIDCNNLLFTCGGPGDLIPSSLDLDGGDGAIIGATAGYNWQINQFVIGAEGDISWADLDSDASLSVPGAGFRPPFDADFEENIDWFATLRGRLGIAVDRVLVFGTGGLALAGVDQDTSGITTPAALGNFHGSSDDTQVGWTAGGGVEFAVAEHITLKAEALYFDLGKQSATATDPTFNGSSYTVSHDVNGVIARAGLNYKF